jgi:hypothetical protein
LLAERLRMSPADRAVSAAQAVEGLKRLRRAVGLPDVAPERAV